MAAPIEQRLHIAIGKIMDMLNQDPAGFELVPDANKSPEENLIDLESKLEELDFVLAALCSAKDAITTAFEDWTELNRRATAGERPELDAAFKAFEAKCKPSAYATEAEKRLTVLRLAKTKLNRSIRGQKLTADNRAATAAAAAGGRRAAVPAAAAAPREEIRHQALTIGKFTGADSENWSEWWELFASINDDTKLTIEKKFLYLRSFIPRESAAGLLIEGFQPAEYTQAIDLLKQNFEKKDKRIRLLQQQLVGLSVCTSLEEVRKMYLNVERICRQLASHGKDTESDYYYNLLESKLTRSMLREILVAKKAAGDDWTTSKFRTTLKNLVESEMEISAILEQGKGEEKKRQCPKKNEDYASLPTENCSAVGDDAEKGNRAEKFSDQKEKRRIPPCFFCQEGHWANNCSDYSTLRARTERLRELDLCIRCCRKGHAAAQCENPLKCKGCDGIHPLALGTEQEIPQQPTNGRKANGANGAALNEDVNASLITLLQSKMTSFNYCLLKCTEASMFNPSKTNEAIQATVFLDSGSQKSMISERLAKALDLQPVSSEQFRLRGVGPPNSANSYSANLVKIGLKTNEAPMEMELFVVPNEHLPAMITVSIRNEEAAELETRPLEAKHKIEAPDVLIGAKYLNELGLEKIRQLPSGFWLSRSIIGPMLDSEGELATVTAFVTQLPQLNSTLAEDGNSLFRRIRQQSLELDDQEAQKVDKAVPERLNGFPEADEKEQQHESERPVNELKNLPIEIGAADGHKSRHMSSLLKEKFQQTKAAQRGDNPLLPSEGRVVLIMDEEVPRNRWRHGRIEELTKSEGNVQTAMMNVPKQRQEQHPKSHGKEGRTAVIDYRKPRREKKNQQNAREGQPNGKADWPTKVLRNFKVKKKHCQIALCNLVMKRQKAEVKKQRDILPDDLDEPGPSSGRPAPKGRGNVVQRISIMTILGMMAVSAIPGALASQLQAGETAGIPAAAVAILLFLSAFVVLGFRCKKEREANREVRPKREKKRKKCPLRQMPMDLPRKKIASQRSVVQATPQRNGLTTTSKVIFALLVIWIGGSILANSRASIVGNKWHTDADWCRLKNHNCGIRRRSQNKWPWQWQKGHKKEAETEAAHQSVQPLRGIIVRRRCAECREIARCRSPSCNRTKEMRG